MTIEAHVIPTELQSFFISRKNFYQLLHWLFLGIPKHTEVLQIQEDRSLEELAEIHEGGRILVQFFDHVTETQLKQTEEEYQRLFLGPGPLVAPPWESYYRSKEHLLFEEWTYQIRDIYHQFGLQFRKENNEPDDHLLLELEFLIYLTERCLKETENERVLELISSQIKFLEEHLLVWVPFFCERVVENTKSQLYLGAAMLLEDFISFDLKSLYEIREAITYV